MIKVWTNFDIFHSSFGQRNVYTKTTFKVSSCNYDSLTPHRKLGKVDRQIFRNNQMGLNKYTKVLFLLLYQPLKKSEKSNEKTQKQPPEVFCKKRCS